MRLGFFIVVFLFFIPGLIAQVDLDKSVSIQVKDNTVSSALIELSKQAGISIAFQPKLFADQKISLHLSGIPLKDALTRCLAGTGIDYKIEEGQIILFRKAAPMITLSGYIKDSRNGERLVLATVFTSDGRYHTTSNDYGFFSLDMLSGNQGVQAQYIGYQSDTQFYDFSNDTSIVISMEPYLTTGEVVITDDVINETDRRYKIGQGKVIVNDDIVQQPALGGETDIYRYIQSQSGVTGGADGLGGLHVRGGNAEHNLVLLDGVPVFNPSHSLGLFSIFNASAIRSIRFIKDGFSARYGGRLASVVDVRTKEGNTINTTGELEVSTIATKAMIELPIQKNKSALLLSGRRTHIDPFLKTFSVNKKAKNFDEGQTDYYFYDFNLKFHSNIGDRNKVYLSYYQGADDFKDETAFDIIYEDENGIDRNQYSYQDQQIFWKNRIGSLRWNGILSDHIFMNVTATYSTYDYGSFNQNLYFDEGDFDFPGYNDVFDNRSSIKDSGVRLDIDHYAGKHQLRYGGAFLSRTFIPASLLVSQETDFIDVEELVSSVDSSELFLGYASNEYTAYVEDLIDLGNDVKLQIGVRASAFEGTNKTHTSVQPRLSLDFPVSEGWKGNLSITKSTQFLHVLSASDAGLPTDIWVPSTDDVDPEQAWQYSGALHGSFGNGWGVDIGAYYKSMTGLLSYFEETKQPGLIENDPEYWEEFVTAGEGESYGVELDVHKSSGTLTGAFNYTYMKSTRTFEDVNDGMAFPFSFDRPHNLNLRLGYRINKKMQLQAAAYFSEGRPYTLLSIYGKFTALSNTFGVQDQVTPVNGVRLADYHRVDVNLQMNLGNGSTKHFINLGVYNLLNSKNPYYQYQSAEDGNLKSAYGLPLLPSVSYKIRFGE